MQGLTLNTRAKIAFSAAQEAFSDNDNYNVFYKPSYRHAMLVAYSIGVAKLGWTDYKIKFDDNYVSLAAYKQSAVPHRSICLWRNPAEDNGGYRFSVHTNGRPFLFCTNSLREALDNFKHPVPKLALLSLQR